MVNKKSETLLERFFYGEEFELWKLNTPEEYAYFFGMVFLTIVVSVFLIRYMNRQRTDEKARERVKRKFRWIAKKPNQYFERVTLRLPAGDQTFDAVLMDKSGIFLIKVFGWGIKVFGTPEGEVWRLEDNQRKEEVPNPLHDLRKGAAELQAALEEKGIKRIRIMPMVIFADSFDTPELYLGYGSCSTTYQEMKSWYQKQSDVKEAQYDFERVSSIIMNELIKK